MALAEANKLANQSTSKLIKATDELTKVVEAMKHSVTSRKRDTTSQVRILSLLSLYKQR